MKTATVHDVAAAILEQTGPLDSFKLHKISYYCQAWHLAWEDATLFSERIEAWATGPAVPSLYENHRGDYLLHEWKYGESGNLSESQRATVTDVVGAYARFTNQELGQIVRNEDPWLKARVGLGPFERGSAAIATVAMRDYYRGVDQSADAVFVDNYQMRGRF